MLLTLYFIGAILFAGLFRLIPVSESLRAPWYIEIPLYLVIGLFWPLVLLIVIGFFTAFFLFGL